MSDSSCSGWEDGNVRILLAFGRNDALSVRRDAFLMAVAFLPWLMVLGLRLIVPPLSDWLPANYDFPAEQLNPLIISLFCLIQLPLLYGLIAGLLILDDRDDGVLTALRVTPLPSALYVGFRLTVATLAAFAAICLAVPLSGLMPLSLLPALVPIAAATSLFAPLIALFLSAFAGNKVEGMAFSKAFGILLVGPLAAYFIEGGWQFALGLLPTYWPAKAYWAAAAGEAYWPYMLAGAAYNLLVAAALYQRFRQRVWR